MENPVPGYPEIRDLPPQGRGPLAGIQAAYRETGNADLLVLACDYPNVETSHLATLLDPAHAGYDLVMPVDDNGRDHPLVALWRRSAVAPVEEAVSNDRLKVRALLPELHVCRLQPGTFYPSGNGRVLANVNTAADLDRLR
jgi:molybdopterin-guanine dinucleotide biosynthesis protein A